MLWRELVAVGTLSFHAYMAAGCSHELKPQLQKLPGFKAKFLTMFCIGSLTSTDCGVALMHPEGALLDRITMLYFPALV